MVDRSSAIRCLRFNTVPKKKKKTTRLTKVSGVEQDMKSDINIAVPESPVTSLDAVGISQILCIHTAFYLQQIYIYVCRLISG